MNNKSSEFNSVIVQNTYIARKEIIRLCHYLESHLEDKIKLSKMEKISGLSSRSLQYGFRKYFGCSPCKWLQNKRLIAAMNKLNFSDEKFNVTSIIYDFGFSNGSTFSKYYKQKFGERPSISLSRNKNRNSHLKIHSV
ncbi:MAG: AraC family transcriptional regulator [Gammaproteobacteria bacterium]|jgi:AraC-like DNA-binding protein|nr:AraC family transcriptional regulator [Gammaproteobacteria bacterium]